MPFIGLRRNRGVYRHLYSRTSLLCPRTGFSTAQAFTNSNLRSSAATSKVPRKLIMNPDIDRILTFWFNRDPIEWIVAPDGLDEQIKSSFSHLVDRARRNELDDWASTPKGSLALVVLLEQFPRNLFRGSAEAFSGDAKAWEVSTRAIAQGFDKDVTVMQSSAFYMPLMHHESLISGIAAQNLFTVLKGRCESEEEHKWVGMAIAAASRHLDQLVKFGRYPTRNAVLGRESTEEEEKFLKEHVASL